MRTHPASFASSTRVVLVVSSLVAALLAVVQVVAAPRAHAAPAPGDITLSVSSARTVNPAAGFVHQGDPVTSYKWLINEDDTGNPGTSANPLTNACLPNRAGAGAAADNTTYADSCPWPSTRKTSGWTPIVAQGDETDLNKSKALQNLPAGKYLISVTADGFKIDGAHFTVNGGSQQVNVQMNPTPLPLSTLRMTVFNDTSPVDATYEVDAEKGLAGFTAHLSDVFGTVSVDYYGNPLCTMYMRVKIVKKQPTLVSAPVDSPLPVAFDANNHPVVDPASTGRCVSDSTGLIIIPNMGPDRYAATITPPVPTAGQTYQWVQTTTLEGGHDHDIWEQEGSTGYDTEQTKGNELVPAVQFGFVKTQALAAPKVPTTGEIKGIVVAQLPYIGGVNGQPTAEGTVGAAFDGPIAKPWIALSDLDNGDQQVYVGQGLVNGSFDIKNVPDGSYALTMWDDLQDYILYSVNVTVENGQVVDVGNEPLVGWFSHLHGKVFIDSNGNGKMDPSEKGVPQFPLSIRERDNTLMDQATNTATTDNAGNYDISEVYPLGKFLILEAFDTRYQTTGITYQGANEPKPTTMLGSAVDFNFLPIIGLGGEVDWAVQPYAKGSNGGIVGTISYDTTRNELDPADAASESYQPGIPDVPVDLYVPVACDPADPNPANDCRQGYQIVPLQVPDPSDPTGATMMTNPATNRGELVKGPKVQQTYTSEKWAAPRGCTARQYDGTPLTDQQALPTFGTAADALCVESPMQGIAMGAADSTPGNFSQTVNGNYGFATSMINLYPPGDPKNPGDPNLTMPNDQLPLYANLAANGYPDQTLPAINYIVSVDIPKDPVDGKPMFQVTKEEDVNVFNGDSYLPQSNFAPIKLAQATDPAGPPANKPTQPSQPPSQQAGIISPCAGALHTVTVTNQAFLDGGGSPFEGQDRPLCTDKLVSVRNNQAVAPNFNLFTDVPLPTHFWGLTLNDLGLTLDKRSVNYGEAQGLPFVPVGLYDYAGRLVDTTHTDFNGIYEALEPSTDTYNCPVPAGPCPNMYRFVGNDPGQPGALNSDYNARFRTIATNFQGWPGLYTVTDEAPTQVAATALAPNGTVVNPTQCDLDPAQPQVLAVDTPYVRRSAAPGGTTVKVQGLGFGANQGSGTVQLTPAGTAPVTMTTTTWDNNTIAFTVPNSFPAGSATLTITADKGNAAQGLSDVNGLTIQVLDTASASTPGTTPTNPQLAEVGPGKPFATIQSALEAATPRAAVRRNGVVVAPAKPYWLVVVWPGAQSSGNPQGEYTENLIVHHQVRIQGVGPGGFDDQGRFVPGTIVDGANFSPDNATGQAWIARLATLRYSGNPAVPTSATVTVLDDPNLATVVPPSYPTSIDGFSIVGGSQSDFATNIVDVFGGTTTPYGAPGALITQGGGIYVHNNVQGLRLTDNIIKGNSGSYGGGIRVGTPYVNNNRNYNAVISRNQIRDNGGTNLAGGIGLFTGSNGYQVDHNALCGNFSAEYGGAMTAFGYQGTGNNGGGRILNNKVWFNASYDEGGGIMLAGELPANPNTLSEGTGPVTLDGNVIQTNLANDDGGGVRLLQTSGSHISKNNPETISITNNTIADNISAHEGGGIALDDAAFVNVVDNTIAKNLTTATAVTSNGTPAPAGLSTANNSDALQLKLCGFNQAVTLCNTKFSKPTLLDDVFNDNRAGNYTGGWVYGIGGTLPDGSTNSVDNWDMGVADDASAVLSPQNSVVQTTTNTDVSPAGSNTSTKVVDVAGFAKAYDVSVNILQFRSNPAFRQALIVAQILPPNLQGDYHLASGSPAYGAGAASTSGNWGTLKNPWPYTVSATTPDIDGDTRPGVSARYDAGSDQATP